MIRGFNEYIDRYICKRELNGLKDPGEHHFVAVYLLPKLFALNGIVPDYVNPDGTKAIRGDIVYFRDDRHYLGLEAKLSTIRLTANEFNNWIVSPAYSNHPQVFIGVGTKGLVVQTWRRFRATYIKMIGPKN